MNERLLNEKKKFSDWKGWVGKHDPFSAHTTLSTYIYTFEPKDWCLYFRDIPSLSSSHGQSVRISVD